MGKMWEWAEKKHAEPTATATAKSYKYWNEFKEDDNNNNNNTIASKSRRINEKKKVGWTYEASLETRSIVRAKQHILAML